MQHPSSAQLYQAFQQHPSVCTDTRNLVEGSIFIALKGETFNGNEYAEKALAGGCAIAIVDEEKYYQGDNYILVEDCLKALQTLAREHRRQFSIPVIGITGSNGKTTTKELLNAVLSEQYTVLCTQGNFNNEIGVPLTLLGLNVSHQIAIIEMGARFQGDIEELVNIAEPTHGLITNVGKAHLETMGGLEGVVKTKTELYRYLEANNGNVFVRFEDAKLIQHTNNLPIFTYGYAESADIIGTLKKEAPHIEFSWKKKSGEFGGDITSPLMGEYNFQNILAAIAVGVFFDVDDTKINKGIANYNPTNNRSQIIKTDRNTLLLDAYNANPSSMEAALRNFVHMDGEGKTLILGEMLEVGDNSEAEHKAILHLAAELGFTEIYLVGDEFAKVSSAFDDAEKLREYLRTEKLTGKTILIKGSRKNKLEMLVDVL